MAKQGHTPGPWEAKRGEDPQWNVWAEKQAVACTAHGNDEANARLIAAAPDLLATCEWAANMERIDPLAECCYQGAPLKKWLKERTQYAKGFNDCLEAIVDKSKSAIAATGAVNGVEVKEAE